MSSQPSVNLLTTDAITKLISSAREIFQDALNAKNKNLKTVTKKLLAAYDQITAINEEIENLHKRKLFSPDIISRIRKVLKARIKFQKAGITATDRIHAFIQALIYLQIKIDDILEDGESDSTWVLYRTVTNGHPTQTGLQKIPQTVAERDCDMDYLLELAIESCRHMGQLIKNDQELLIHINKMIEHTMNNINNYHFWYNSEKESISILNNFTSLLVIHDARFIIVLQSMYPDYLNRNLPSANFSSIKSIITKLIEELKPERTNTKTDQTLVITRKFNVALQEAGMVTINHKARTPEKEILQLTKNAQLDYLRKRMTEYSQRIGSIITAEPYNSSYDKRVAKKAAPETKKYLENLSTIKNIDNPDGLIGLVSENPYTRLEECLKLEPNLLSLLKKPPESLHKATPSKPATKSSKNLLDQLASQLKSYKVLKENPTTLIITHHESRYTVHTESADEPNELILSQGESLLKKSIGISKICGKYTNEKIREIASNIVQAITANAKIHAASALLNTSVLSSQEMDKVDPKTINSINAYLIRYCELIEENKNCYPTINIKTLSEMINASITSNFQRQLSLCEQITSLSHQFEELCEFITLRRHFFLHTKEPLITWIDSFSQLLDQAENRLSAISLLQHQKQLAQLQERTTQQAEKLNAAAEEERLNQLANQFYEKKKKEQEERARSEKIQMMLEDIKGVVTKLPYQKIKPTHDIILTTNDLQSKCEMPEQADGIISYTKLFNLTSCLLQSGFQPYLSGYLGLDLSQVIPSLLKHRDADIVILTTETRLSDLESMLNSFQSGRTFNKVNQYNGFKGLSKFSCSNYNDTSPGVKLDITVIATEKEQSFEDYFDDPSHQSSFAALVELLIVPIGDSQKLALGIIHRAATKPRSYTIRLGENYINLARNRYRSAVSTMVHVIKCSVKSNQIDAALPLLLMLNQLVSNKTITLIRTLMAEKLPIYYWRKLGQMCDYVPSLRQLFPNEAEAATTSSNVTH